MSQRLVSVLLSVLLSLSSGAGVLAPQEDPYGTLLLVNKQNRAPSVKPELTLPNVAPSKPEIAQNLYMRPDAAQALEEMFQAAAAEGVVLYGVSGYRSYSTQKAIYDRRVGESGDSAKRWVAPPGYSEHQTGLAMDLTGESTVSQGLTDGFADTPEGRWVAENCHRFGFIVRYQKEWEAITGYGYEPWHVRFVGSPHAELMYEAHITLEEYLQRLRAQTLSTLMQ